MRNVSDGRSHPGRRDGREVHHGLCAGECVEALARVGQVGHEAEAVGAAIVRPVDVEDVVARLA